MMKEHIQAKFVNNLRDIAVEFHNHQSLRQRILEEVNRALEEDDLWWKKEREYMYTQNSLYEEIV